MQPHRPQPSQARDAARAAADAAYISVSAHLDALVLADAQHHLVRPDDRLYTQQALTA